MLDEPNSNLDDLGEAALVQAIQALKSADRTVVMITHRTNVLATVDNLLVLRDGQVLLYGPRDGVLARLKASNVVPAQRGATVG